MFELRVNVRENFGRLLGKVGQSLRKAEKETELESEKEAGLAEPQSEEEEALHQAMGWSDDEAEDAGDVARKKISEALEGL